MMINFVQIFDIYWIAGEVEQLPVSWPEYANTEYNMNTPAKVILNGTAADGVYLHWERSRIIFCSVHHKLSY